MSLLLVFLLSLRYGHFYDGLGWADVFPPSLGGGLVSDLAEGGGGGLVPGEWGEAGEILSKSMM